MRRRSLLCLAALALGAAGPAEKPPLAAVPISRMETPWWKARHEAKLMELRRGKVDLVFLGDSITENWEKSGPPEWQDFQPIWTRFYGDRNAVNLGFKGDATSHLLWRLQHGELDGIAPKVAVLLIGANNLGRAHWPTAENLRGIDAVIGEVRKRLPATRILLLSVLPSGRSAWASQTTSEMNRALMAKYANHAVANVTFQDVTSVFLRDGAFDRTQFYDTLLTPPEPPLHPTAQAQARLAVAIEPTLAALLGDRVHSAR
jgi:lysophospholipase L1-like esterase